MIENEFIILNNGLKSGKGISLDKGSKDLFCLSYLNWKQRITKQLKKAFLYKSTPVVRWKRNYTIRKYPLN